MRCRGGRHGWFYRWLARSLATAAVGAGSNSQRPFHPPPPAPPLQRTVVATCLRLLPPPRAYTPTLRYVRAVPSTRRGRRSSRHTCCSLDP